MKNLKTSVKRLERLFQIRETSVSVAVAGVEQAEAEVGRLKLADTEVAGKIQHSQTESANLRTASAQDLQGRERHIQALQMKRESMRQLLAQAVVRLEQRQQEWTEAMREQKIVEEIQRRRSHEWEREEHAANQKAQDDASIERYVRARIE